MRSLILLSLVLTVFGQAPIPASPPGLEYKDGDPNALVRLDIFIDPMCPDCKAAWPTMKLIQAHYGSSLRLFMHPFPLPYHRNSFLASQAIFLVKNLKSKEDAFKFVDAIFDAYPKFGNTQTMNTTELHVIQSMASIANKVAFVEWQTFVDKMTMQNAPSDGLARVAWKYGCTRGVYGTPTFFVNGVTVAADYDWTVAQWAKLLDSVVDPK